MPPSIYYDVISLLPAFLSGQKAPAGGRPMPEIGQEATLSDELPFDSWAVTSPTSSGQSGSTGGTILSFVRHCGCPFAEAEVRELAQLLLAQEKESGGTGSRPLRGVIVCMSEEDVANGWYEGVLSRAGLSASSLSAHLTLVPNPTRTLYAHYGLSEPLALSSVLGPSVLSAVFTLKSESGIANTATGRGSDRWQNSGGLAVDQSGTVRWRKIAKDASDRCRWEEAKTALLA